jgi:hypothetical protein
MLKLIDFNHDEMGFTINQKVRTKIPTYPCGFIVDIIDFVVIEK